MATGTTSSNISGILSDEETNYLRAAHLIIHICPKAVRKLFDSHHPPPQLTGQLAAKQAILQKCPGIDKRHWPMLFPTHGAVKSLDFDITLLMTLLRNFTLIPQPNKTRWNTMPAASDHSEVADLVRIRLYRNEIVHSNDATLANSDFKLLWTELENAVDRLSGGTMKTKVNDLLCVVLDQTQRELTLTSLQHEKKLMHHEKEIKEIKKEHGEDIEAIKQKHEKEMKEHGEKIEAIKQKHWEEIEAIKRKHEEDMKGHGEKIEVIKQIHEEEIEAIKQKHEEEMKGHTEKIEAIEQKHGEEIEAIKQRHEEEMKGHGEKIEAIKQKHGEEIEAIRQKHEKEMKVKKKEIRKLKWEQKQTIPHNVRVQHTNILKEWERDVMVFYETTGCKGALKLLKSKKYITIIASPGAGKSAIAHHIALELRKEGWEVVPIDDLDELINYGSFDNKQVFVIDDVVGVFSVEMSRLDAFSRKKKKVLNLMQNQTMLIMTCRKVVYNEVKKFKSFVTDFVLDLENSDFKLRDNEKTEILLNHCKAAKISPKLCENIPLSSAKVMFPLLCKFFCNEPKYQKMGKQFFERPYECLLEKLEDLKERLPLQYAGLVLLCLRMRKVLSKKECESDKNFRSLKKTVFDIYGVNHGTPASKIINALSLLDGTYTKPASDGFTFIHDSIFELVAYHHSKSYPEHILKYSSSNYVYNRVTVDNPPTVDETTADGSLYIKLKKKHYKLLAERIFDDIGTLKLYDVFKNPVLKKREFCDAFIKILQGTNFRNFKRIFLESHFNKYDISKQRAEDETDTHMPIFVETLLETGNTRLIRWIVFYGPTHLLEFVIDRVKRHRGKHALKRTADGLAVKGRTIKLLFGDDKEQTLLLVIACCGGDVDRVRLILQHVNPSCVNTSLNEFPAYTPLTAACFYGHLPVVEVLIQHRAGVDTTDALTGTPLSRASESGHCDIVRYLIDHGGDPNIPVDLGSTALYRASYNGHCNIVRYLIDHCADPNKHDMYGSTPLYTASERGHYDIVSLLLDSDADVNISYHDGTSPLQIALYSGKINVVRMIVKHTNKVRTDEGNKLLYHELIQLKQLEVNEEETSKKGRIVYKGSKRTRLSEGLWCSIQHKECDVLRWLLMLGLDVNCCDKRGKSLLCRLLDNRFYPTETERKVKLLLESGADLNMRDNKCVSVTGQMTQRMCYHKGKLIDELINDKYMNLDFAAHEMFMYYAFCNKLNMFKCHVRRYSV